MKTFLLIPILAALLPNCAAAEDVNLHLQATATTQAHGSFTSPYQGTNSLNPNQEEDTSLTWTLFGGLRLWDDIQFYVNPEMAGGKGFSQTRGVAGFPNGEIYRVDDPSPKWSLARVYFKKSFGFGGEQEAIADEANQLSDKIDKQRFTIVIGRFSLNDYFDNNAYSHDPRTQFSNWAFMDNGAWDYAADTRGYSWGVYLEYNQDAWAVRFASVLEPTQANGPEYDLNYPQVRGDNLEFEYRKPIGEHANTVRALVYENHADMGNYRQTLDTPSANLDVTKTRSLNTKYGFGLNEEFAITENWGAFARLSWNDGHTETWAFTEIDQALSLGVLAKGAIWDRAEDAAGLAVAVSGLSNDHRDYLASGGYGFLIGDGKLNYQTEDILELFYRWQVLHGLQLSGDYQFILHPAYNADRGPVSSFGLRLHYEI